jgi:enoyl-CoA hydratase/carnithine racemase
MMSQAVITERHDRTTVVTIDCPDRCNAVNLTTARVLLAAFETFNNNKNSGRDPHGRR